MILNEPFSVHIGALNASDASITWDFATANISVVLQPLNNSYIVLVSNSSSDSGYIEVNDTFGK